ncbi:hypothetical protein BU23DRAFT_580404 [Bimuria novae-zelandiae CBS 107.79]|uniref:EamA domain-containing protein n=1 Tax=Bimuria novae-zelandiae CBS 107.79 TaxID=1447943 RepID=A0A6A5V9M8_9PLEO|nr:hypothetical protein BU23DRAFT_580404 [Bimuria novae-zelandiae CBS 107.79]
MGGVRSYGATDDSATASDQYAAASSLGNGSVHGEENEPQDQSNTARRKLKQFYERNFGLFLVFLAQTCGSAMNTAAKLLATGYETKFHALQIIFVRMSCTTVLSCLYIWYNKIPRSRGVTGLLILRGFAGFVGLFGLYYSLSWLEFADATVIAFLIPTMTALVCWIWLKEPYTLKEALAGLLAFTGVLFVARPPWLFPSVPLDPISGRPTEPRSDPSSDSLSSLAIGMLGVQPPTLPPVSAEQRTVAILLAVLGTFAASIAYATIRVIGKRAHSLVSVTYFAFLSTAGSAFIIFVHPDLKFVMPESLGQWGLIAVIGFAGFALQFLLTEGLQREKGGRATNLTYLQLVFALLVERIIWGTTPPIESLFGAVLIIVAAVWVSLQKNAEKKEVKAVDEERSLLGDDQEQVEDRRRSVVSMDN